MYFWSGLEKDMGEEFEFYSEEIIKEMIDRFQKMLETGKSLFFDIDALSAIIDHYFESGDLDLLKKALDMFVT